MPLTPFHWSVLVFGVVFFNSLYLPALAISSVIIDIEPLFNILYYVLISQTGSIVFHSFFHTYLGATIVGAFVGFCLIRTRKKYNWSKLLFGIDQEFINDTKIYATSLLAAWSHVFLDSFMYADLKPFWPITDYNPFLGTIPGLGIYVITSLALFLAITIYFFHLLKR